MAEENWRKISKEWRDSGLSQVKFCDKKNIPYNKFVYFYNKLKRRNHARFAQVMVGNSAPAELSTPNVNSCIKLLLPKGIQVFIPTNISPAIIVNIITLLGGKKC